MSGSGAAGSVTAVIAPPCAHGPSPIATGLAGRGADLAWLGSALKSMPFDFGAGINGIGEARDGSHEAERMSRPI
jgi:hypothetical protein